MSKADVKGIIEKLDNGNAGLIFLYSDLYYSYEFRGKDVEDRGILGEILGLIQERKGFHAPSNQHVENIVESNYGAILEIYNQIKLKDMPDLVKKYKNFKSQ